MPATTNAISNQLTEDIVENYNGRASLFKYKSNWCTRISRVLRSMNIKYV